MVKLVKLIEQDTCEACGKPAMTTCALDVCYNRTAFAADYCKECRYIHAYEIRLSRPKPYFFWVLFGLTLVGIIGFLIWATNMV